MWQGLKAAVVPGAVVHVPGALQTHPAGWFHCSRLWFARVITASNKLPREMSSQSHKN